jgi:hypothetical protein
MPDNQLFQGNKFPGSPFSALVLIYNSVTGLYQLSFNPSFNQTYPSDPTTITAATPISQSPYAGEILIARSTGVDFNDGSGNKIALYTVPAASIFIPTRVLIRNASTSLTTASVSFGFNGNTANDVIANATYTALTGATLYTVVSAKAGSTRGAAADVFGVRVNTPQGGAATVTIETFGFLVTV